MIELLFSIIIFLYLIELITSPTIFECDRLADKCIRKSKHFWQSAYKERFICRASDIESAQLEKRWNGPHIGFYAVLELKNKQHYYLFPSSVGISYRYFCEKNIKTINEFIDGKADHVKIKDGVRWIPFILLAFIYSLVLLWKNFS